MSGSASDRQNRFWTGFDYISKGLTVGEMATLNSAIEIYQTALGRNV